MISQRSIRLPSRYSFYWGAGGMDAYLRVWLVHFFNGFHGQIIDLFIEPGFKGKGQYFL